MPIFALFHPYLPSKDDRFHQQYTEFMQEILGKGYVMDPHKKINQY